MLAVNSELGSNADKLDVEDGEPDVVIDVVAVAGGGDGGGRGGGGGSGVFGDAMPEFSLEFISCNEVILFFSLGKTSLLREWVVGPVGQIDSDSTIRF